MNTSTTSVSSPQQNAMYYQGAGGMGTKADGLNTSSPAPSPLKGTYSDHGSLDYSLSMDEMGLVEFGDTEEILPTNKVNEYPVGGDTQLMNGSAGRMYYTEMSGMGMGENTYPQKDGGSRAGYLDMNDEEEMGAVDDDGHNTSPFKQAHQLPSTSATRYANSYISPFIYIFFLHYFMVFPSF